MAALGQAYIDVHANTTKFGPELKEQIGKIVDKAVFKVLIEPKTIGFKQKMQAAVDAMAPVKVKVEAAGAATLRTQIQAAVDAKPIKIRLEGAGIPALRAQIQAALQASPINLKLHITQAEIDRIKTLIRTQLSRIPAIQIRFDSAHALTQLAQLTAAMNAATAAAGRLSGATAAAGSAMNSFGGSASSAGGILQGAFSSAVSGAIGGVEKLTKLIVGADAAFATFGIKGTLELEQLETAIAGVVRGNAAAAGKTIEFKDALEQAKDQIKEIQKFAKIAPQFDLHALIAASRNLQTMGITGEEALDTVKILTNALVAAGNASDDTLRGSVLPLLQAFSTGKFLGQDLNQLAQRLPGVFSRGEVFKELRANLDIGRAAVGQAKLTVDQVEVIKKSLDGVSKLTNDEFDKIREAGLPANQTIQAVLKTLRDSPVAADALKNASNTVRGQLFALRRSVEQRVRGLFEPIRAELIKSLKQLRPEIDKAFVTIGPAIRDFILRLVPIITALIPALASAFGFFNQVLFATIDVISTVISRLVTDFQRLRDFLHGNSEAATVLRNIFANLAGTVENLRPIFESVIQGLQLGFAAVGPIVLAFAGTVALLARVFSEILASDVGSFFVTLSVAIAALVVTVNLLVASYVRVAASAAVAAAAQLILTARFIAGSLAAAATALATGSLTGALAALRAAALAAGGAMVVALGPLGAAVAIGAAAGAAIVFVANKLGFLGSKSKDVEQVTLNIKELDGTISRIKVAANSPIAIRFLDNTDQVSANLVRLSANMAAFARQFTAQTGFMIDSIDALNAALGAAETAKAIAAGEAFGPTIPGQPRPRAGLGLPRIPDLPPSPIAGLDKGDKAGKAAADKARRAAELFRDRIRDILESLNAAFLETLTTGTQKAVDNALSALIKSIRVAFKGRKTNIDDAMILFIQASNKKLDKLIRERDGLTNRFGEHVDGLLDRLTKAVDRAKSVADSVRSFAAITNVDFKKAVEETAATITKLNTTVLDVAGSFLVTSRTIETATDKATEDIKRTGVEFSDALKARLDAIKAFRADIEALIAAGLDKNIIDEIIGAGVEGGATTADALANASKSVIDTINETQKEIDAQADALGNRAADSLFRSGKTAADGLIEGLKERRAEIADIMGDISQNLIDGLIAGLNNKKSEFIEAVGDLSVALVKKIKKDLGIKSPSRVAQQLFQRVGDGAVLGLNNSVAGVTKAAAGLGAAGLPSPGSFGQMPGQRASSSGGVTAEHLDRVIAAVAGARPNKEIHAPITQHFASPVTPASAKMAFSTVARR